MSAAKKNDRYRDTLQLPRTDFAMRAGLLEKEPAYQTRWREMDLYRRVLDAPELAARLRESATIERDAS